MTVEIVSFKNSPALRLVSPSGGEATVLLHGAQVVSWKQDGRTERLYLSDMADLSPGAAIRGGIPVCFPQFSTLGPCPMHGFARNLPWRRTGATTDGDAVTLELCETEETLAVWPHRFAASLTVAIEADTLSVALEAVNTGAAPLAFTTALHTYLRVGDIGQVSIEGLAGTTYHDKIANLENQTETRREITFSGATDRVYYNAAPDLTLRDGSRRLAIHARNMPDAVIWNPGAERARSIADLTDDGYRHMVCVEAGAIGKPVTLEAGESWRGSQILRV